KRISCSRAAAFRVGPLVTATGRMRIDFIWWTVFNVNAPAIRSPTLRLPCKMIVGKGDSAIVLFLKLVLSRARCRIAACPELLHKVLAFWVRLQAFEGSPLLIRDDIDHILIEPFLPRIIYGLLRLLRHVRRVVIISVPRSQPHGGTRHQDHRSGN